MPQPREPDPSVGDPTQPVGSEAPAASGAAVARVAAYLIHRATPGLPLIVGVTGSVAAGKTTLCGLIANRLRHTRRVETISTDGFLLPNAELTDRDLMRRKGFPNSYNHPLMSGVLQRARWGAVDVPGYSHERYDIDPALSRTIDRPDILLVEGLGLPPDLHHRKGPKLLDVLIYLDADEHALEAWFIERFLRLWRAAESNPSSFYSRFRSMTAADTETFARSVWADINLPNLRDHISLARDAADIVLHKDDEHAMTVASLGQGGADRPHRFQLT